MVDPAKVLYLDTNHMSTLAGIRPDLGAGPVRELLDSGDAVLAFSIVHMIELSAPTFRSVDLVRRLLSEFPIVFATIREQIFDQEMLAAHALTYGYPATVPEPFVERLEEWHDRKAPPGFGAVDMLDFLIERPEIREEMLAIGQRGAEVASLKEQAYVVRDRTGPIVLRLRDELPALLRERGIDSKFAPEEIVSAMGGVEGFPSYAVWQSLSIQRLLHPGFITEPNDIWDEYQASYAPYAAVTALDRRTAHRVREARLPCSSRVTSCLSDVPRLFLKVSLGDLKLG